jgi:TetR/AcrR family transcriptional regulator, biofilm operon repressor
LVLKVSVVHLYQIMKQNILQTATHLFLSQGFKSITMDDIAGKMAISKKTLYKYFENKETLIEACADFIHHDISIKIEAIFNQDKNAIEENFIIREMFNQMFKSDGDSPVYQLKKHYPLIYSKVHQQESEQCKDIFRLNIQKGIKQGHYKSDINVKDTVLFYYLLIFGINETFQSEKEVNQLELAALIYHTNAIATPLGLQELEKQLIQYNLK